MPLRDDLLNPIAGPNPSGQNLKYAAVYDKIKDARREDDDAPQGDWQRERKLADYAAVIKIAGDALATKTKDVQIAAWLVEALLKREGYGGLREGLQFTRGLLENFWDTLYPEIEDGDVELRSAPLEWVGSRLEEALKKVPLTGGGHDWFQYKESRTIPSEDDANQDEKKREVRDAKLADGKLAPEQFDLAFKETPKAFYAAAVGDLDAVLELIESLNEFCGEKFGDAAPSFSKLRDSVTEVRHTANALLNEKRKVEPDEPSAEAAEEAPGGEAAGWGEQPAEAAAGARVARKTIAAEPVDRDDAAGRLAAVAAWLRREDPASPAPYLLLRGFRWGEVRAGGDWVDQTLLEAPSTEVRTRLKKLALESNWQDLIEPAEAAMARPCGRGWLDLQRYVVRACRELGYDKIAAAIISELRALLADLPGLVEMSMMDDTQTANAETQAWIKEEVTKPPSSAQPAEEAAPSWGEEPAAEGQPQEGAPPPPPDSYQLAMEAARGGQYQEAIEILSRELAHERSGRGRFQRRLQIAQVCLATGNEAIAHPILEDLAREIDQRNLENWESAEVVAHPLALLFRCISKLDGAPEEKQKLYSRICRLDPQQALACSR